MAKLSIILPVYNVESYLQRCLNSLAFLIVDDDNELIIINDGSSDLSLKIAKQFASFYNNVFVVSQTNAGLSAARNKGLEYAKGDYVWFVDSDDYVEQQQFKPIQGFMDTQQYDVIVFGRIDEYAETVKQNQNLDTISYTSGVSYFNDSISNDVYRTNAWDKIFRRNLLESYSIRFVEGKLYEDMLFCFEAFLYAKDVIQCNTYPYHYNLCNTGSITKTVRESDLDVLWYIAEAEKMFHDKVFVKRFSSKAYNQMIFNWVNSCIIKKYASISNINTVANKICKETFDDKIFRSAVYYCATHKVKLRQWIMALLIILSPKLYCRIVAIMEKD